MPLTRSSVIVGVIAVFCAFFAITSPILADEAAEHAASRPISSDGAPNAPKEISAGKALRVAQLAGDSWIVRQLTGPVRRDGTDQAVMVVTESRPVNDW
jgi:hypothetical protein